MNHIRPLLLSVMLLVAVLCSAQMKITDRQRLSPALTGEYSHPQFSPDGKAIFFTTPEANGIWQYTLPSGQTQQITSDSKTGVSFTISRDGRKIAYRRTTTDKVTHRQKQELIVKDLTTGSTATVATGSDISLPAFSESELLYSIGSSTKNLNRMKSADGIKILGIENTKIILLRNGQKRILDPLKNGSYIWPVLSPDKKTIAAYEMDRGTFVCDLNGKILARLGRRNAPSWTRDSKWLVYMNDKDDGHQILSSDLQCISPDGKTAVQLTSTPDIFEMYPHCSPTENKIICSTLKGELYLLTYTVESK
ncbi:MAG: hypothetical protein V1799_20725 [bacterium]